MKSGLSLNRTLLFGGVVGGALSSLIVLAILSVAEPMDPTRSGFISPTVLAVLLTVFGAIVGGFAGLGAIFGRFVLGKLTTSTIGALIGVALGAFAGGVWGYAILAAASPPGSISPYLFASAIPAAGLTAIAAAHHSIFRSTYEATK
jgi:hypothetical protein